MQGKSRMKLEVMDLNIMKNINIKKAPKKGPSVGDERLELPTSSL